MRPSPLVSCQRLRGLSRARFNVLSDRIDGWMHQWGPRVLRYGSIAFGVLLLGDAALTAAFSWRRPPIKCIERM